MAIDRVTITGADDSIGTAELLHISRDFPFVEWGILVSKRADDAGGSPRYPSAKWITDLQGIAESCGGLNLSLHICGRWVRDLLLGKVTFPINLLHCFARVQLNFHAERTKCEPAAFADSLKGFGRDILFQFDGADGNRHMDAASAEEVGNLYALFDVSGGAGILPQKWPQPIYLDVQPGEHGMGEEYWDYHGYAGGLGPENLAEQIPLILKAAAATEHTREGRIWIDMETRVRSSDDRQFDLAKVRRCLEIAAPFISPNLRVDQTFSAKGGGG